MKIVVRTPNWLGDCIMALPVFRELRKKYPQAEIVAACRKNVADCFCASKDIDRVIIAPGRKAGLAEYFSSLQQLRKEKFDIGILTTNSFGTALWLFLGGVKRRIGFARDGRGILLTDRVAANTRILTAHQGEYYLYPLQRLGIDSELGYPELYVSESAEIEAEKALSDAGISGRSFAVIAPLSAYGGVKDWGNDKYSEVAARVADELNMDVLLTGTPEQHSIIQEICGSSKGVYNFAGKVSLSGYMALVKRATLYIGGDSGGAHTAAALGVPTITIFGITEPSRTKALGREVVVVGDGGMCTPDLKDPEVQKAARNALDKISVQMIIDHSKDLMMNANKGK